MVTLGGSLGPLLHFAVARHSSQNAPLAHLFNLLKAKAVPVAASSSEIASARPTGPELRPRSFTALRIQHSSKDAVIGRRMQIFKLSNDKAQQRRGLQEL